MPRQDNSRGAGVDGRRRSRRGQPSVAIIGAACRFPGSADSPAAFWDLLASGHDCVTEIPDDRWDKRRFGHPDVTMAGRSYTFAAGTLNDVGGFDAAFFDISPREAEQMDPQQRLLLEMTWEALERGGQVPEHIAGTPCAVYVGISSKDYADVRIGDFAGGNAYFMLGSTLSIAANRISYIFDLRGPSMAVDTACSSAMVALHEAYRAIRGGQVSMAIVGGISLLLSPIPFGGFSRAAMLSPRGRCSAFDKMADGYVRAEGGGVLILKALDVAERDGDPIQAVLRGVGLNNDGHTAGIARPSGEAQEALLRQVYAECGVAPRELVYFEAHGTGTAIGDPIEARAIGQALGQARARSRPLPIGSVKSNIGHLEPASGMASLIKSVEILKHGVIPPSLHIDEPNPEIDFAGLNLVAARSLTPIRKTRHPAKIGVNSFGFGGANAHAIVEEYRPPPAAADDPETARPAVSAAPAPIYLSARSDEALRDAAGRIAALLVAPDRPTRYAVARTLATRRAHLEHRLAARHADDAALAAALAEFAGGGMPDALTAGQVLTRAAPVAFVFSGNGSQWQGMGAQLFDDDASFRGTVERIDEIMRAEHGWSVVEAIRSPPEDGDIEDARIAQPLLFAVQMGIVGSLAARGLVAAAVVGHSVGEIAAACAAGALTLEQGVRVIMERSAAQAQTRGVGCMATADVDIARAERDMAAFDGRIEIAGDNSPTAVTLSGEPAALQAYGERLAAENAGFRMLGLDYAYHNRVLDPMRDALLQALDGLTPNPTACRFYSTVDGGACAGDRLCASYWWENVRRPVRFREAITAMAEAGSRIFVEIGPHPILQGYIRQTLKAANTQGQPVVTMSRRGAGAAAVDAAADRAYGLGARLDFAHVFAAEAPVVDLPTYPWQHEHHWFQLTPEARVPILQRTERPLIGFRPMAGVACWESLVDTGLVPFLADHAVGGSVVFPAAGFLEMALEASSLLFEDACHDVEHLEISRPLVLEPGRSKNVRFTWNPDDCIFRVESRTFMHDEPWSLHATGRLAKAQHRPPDTVAAPALEPARRYDRAAHYAFTAELGFAYGERFQALHAVAVAQGEARGEIALPDGLDVDGYELHPVLFDGCLQALFDVVRDVRPEDDETPIAFLPYQIGRFLHHGRGGAVARCAVTLLRANERSLLADFVMFDVDGAVLAEARNVRFHRAELGRRRSASAPLLVTETVPLRELVQTEATPVIDMKKAIASVAEMGADAPAPPDLRDVAGAFAMAALDAVGAGDAFAVEDLMVDAALPADRHALVAHCCALAAEAGLLAPDGPGRWHRAAPPRDDAAALWRSRLADMPHCVAELSLIGRMGRALPAVLLGADPVQAAPSESMLDHLFGASPTFAAGHEAVVRAAVEMVSAWPTDSQIRVLQLGGASGALSRRLVEAIDAPNMALTITDRDEDAVARLTAELAGDRRVTVVRLDLAADGEPAAELDGDGYHLVVGGNVLTSYTATIAAVSALGRIVAPGGTLVLAEPEPTAWLDLALAWSPDWWRDGGTAAPVSRLVAPDSLAELVAAAGLLRPRLIAMGGTQVLLARRRAAQAGPEAGDLAAEPAGTWLLLAGEGGREAAVADALAERLGAAALRVLPGCPYECADGRVRLDAAEPGAWSALWRDMAMRGRHIAGIVHLLGLAECGEADPPSPMEAQDRRAWSAVALVRSLKEMPAAERPGVALVTSGMAGTFGVGAAPAAAVAEAPMWGVGRVLQNEHPEAKLRLIDLDGSAAGLLADALSAELTSGSDETEVLLGAGRRLGVRVRPVEPPADRADEDDDEATTRVLSFTTGGLDRLAWSAARRRPPGPGEVEVAVRATGLNFRDVMLALGALPPESVENGFAGATLGMEAAGVITRVGHGVTELAVGDEALCFAPACFASHVTTTARTLARLPAGMGFAEGATIPVVFFTVYYALHTLAQLEAGERILIHGAAGGVGLAAVQYARYVGAEIYATAGTQEKRELVALAGVPAEHVFDSRSTAFADQVLAATGGEGVDVVLNSLAGEAIHKGLLTLRPFGRFVELGKRDFYANSRIGLRPFRNNISYFAVDSDQLMAEKPQLAARLFREMGALFDGGAFSPLPYRIFDDAHVAEAFRYMQQSRQFGKIVVVHPPAQAAPAARAAEAIEIDPRGAYLVTGGTGGFGLACAKWLAARGARHLVLVSRSGAAGAQAETGRAELAAMGASVEMRACDVADEAQVNALIAGLAAPDRPPLKGVIHAAAVYDDAIADKLTHDQYRRVLAPKLAGAWALHRATEALPLDLFVLFSSITTLLGNPGQANYVAANMALEALAAHRRARGLPALAVCWGAVSDVGFLERNPDRREALESFLGAGAMTSADALAWLDRLPASATGSVAVAEVDWRTLRPALPVLKTPRFLPVSAGAEAGDGAGGAADLQALIADLTPEEIRNLVVEMLAEQVGHILRLPANRVDIEKSIFDMGMDSLMALELRMAVEEKFGIELPALAISERASIAQLADFVRDHLVAPVDEQGAEGDDVVTLLARHAETMDETELRVALDEVDAEYERQRAKLI